MRLDFATFAARPDLIPLANQFPGGWHEFMYHDPVAPLYFDQAETTWAEYALIATDAADPTRPVARAYSVPFDVPADPADLPPDGWDRVVLTSALELAAGRHGGQVSALEITIQPQLRGKGLAGQDGRPGAGKLGGEPVGEIGPVRAQPLVVAAFEDGSDLGTGRALGQRGGPLIRRS